MFRYSPQQCVVLDAIGHWFGREKDAQLIKSEQIGKRRNTPVLYDYHTYSEAVGLEQRAREALVSLIRVGYGLGLTKYAMTQAMRTAPHFRHSKSRSIGQKFFDEAKEFENYSTSKASQVLQNLFESEPRMWQLKNEPFRERRMALDAITRARKPQLAYRAEKGAHNCKTPYDDKVREAVEEAYYPYALGHYPQLSVQDIANAYGGSSRKTIQRIIDEYDRKGDYI